MLYDGQDLRFGLGMRKMMKAKEERRLNEIYLLLDLQA